MRIESARFRRRSARNADGTLSVIRNSNGQGIALITSLLLLLLMSILGLGMVLSVNSDMLINGYYGSYRSAYYAADAGLNVARQALIGQIEAQVNMTPCASWNTSGTAGNCTFMPITNATSAATTALQNVESAMGSYQPLNQGSATSSWPSSYQVLSSASSFAPTAAGIPASCPASGCNYVFQYTLVSQGKGPALQTVKTQETGQLTINIVPNVLGCTTNCTTTTASFSSFGAFISNFAADSSPLVYGTITGPQFTNGSWNFGTGGSYTFTDPVGQSGSTVSYDFPSGGGYHYVNSASSSASYSGTTIAPNFQGGLQVGLATSPLPTDAFSQLWAVLDGAGCGEGSNQCGVSTSPDPPNPTSSTLATYLKDVNGNPYPTGGATTGVFLPYTGSATSGTLTGGGFYLEGGANSVTLAAGTDSSNNPTEVYTIVQTNSSNVTTTTTITTNIAKNTTTVVSATTTTTYSWGHSTTTTTTTTANLSGVPNTSPPLTQANQTLLYANGDIGGGSGGSYTGLSGTIQNGVQLSVVASGDMYITGNLTYLEEPVTLNSSDSLIASNVSALNGAVLGLYTQSGNFNLVPSSNNGNLEVDGAMAAIGQGCASNSCGLETPGNSVGTLTIVGGRIEGNAHGVNMGTSNTYYDRRFLQSGFAPPWFPSTTVSRAVLPPQPIAPIVTPQYSRLNWSTSPQ